MLLHQQQYEAAVAEARRAIALDPNDVDAYIALANALTLGGEAAEALDTLIKLGFLMRDDLGRLQQATPTVTTGPEMRSLHLANYHRNMIAQGAEALDRFPPSQRDISAITLAVGEDGIERLRRAVQRFRRELLDLAELEERPSQVVQMNFQLFPLTERTTPEGEE